MNLCSYCGVPFAKSGAPHKLTTNTNLNGILSANLQLTQLTAPVFYLSSKTQNIQTDRVSQLNYTQSIKLRAFCSICYIQGHYHRAFLADNPTTLSFVEDKDLLSNKKYQQMHEKLAQLQRQVEQKRDTLQFSNILIEKDLSNIFEKSKEYVQRIKATVPNSRDQFALLILKMKEAIRELLLLNVSQFMEELIGNLNESINREHRNIESIQEIEAKTLRMMKQSSAFCESQIIEHQNLFSKQIIMKRGAIQTLRVYENEGKDLQKSSKIIYSSSKVIQI